MNEVVLEINNENYDTIIKNIKKFLKRNKLQRIKLINKTTNINLKELETIITAHNIKDIRKRYEYIYDEVTKKLTNEFATKNICEFIDNKCIAVRNGGYIDNDYGCCYGKKRGLCKHFSNTCCNINCLSCKLFTCRYLRKKGIVFKIKDIKLLDIFFNRRQKYIIEYSIFEEKETIIKKLLDTI